MQIKEGRASLGPVLANHASPAIRRQFSRAIVGGLASLLTLTGVLAVSRPSVGFAKVLAAYKVTDLGLPAGASLMAGKAINDSGDVAGVAIINNVADAFLWNHVTKKYHLLGEPGGMVQSYGQGIDAFGHVAVGVDDSKQDEHPYLATLQNNTVHWCALGGLNGAKTTLGSVEAISPSGDVAGSVQKGKSQVPVLWRYTAPKHGAQLSASNWKLEKVSSSGSAELSGVSTPAFTVGQRLTAGNTPPVYRDNRVAIGKTLSLALPAVAKTSVVSTNLIGSGKAGGNFWTVVSYQSNKTALPAGSYFVHAENNPWRTVRTIFVPAPAGFVGSDISALTSTPTGLIGVGMAAEASYREEAIVARVTSSGDPFSPSSTQAESTATDLNTLIPTASGWDLGNAYAVNHKGQIVGFGQYKGGTHAFLLTPTA